MKQTKFLFVCALLTFSMIFVACGGDGTIHEVLNAICQSEKDSILGILPSGKGNDLARELNIPSQPTRAIDILLSGQTKYIDVGVFPVLLTPTRIISAFSM